jgi:hypothetical protein
VSVGTYGDLFWNLAPSMVHMAGAEFHVRIYVANTTGIDREYMLMAIVSRDEQVLSEFPVTVDGAAWFSVGAGDVVSLPGAMTVDYSDAVLTLNLYERVTGEITDSISTVLLSQESQYYPLLPALPQMVSEAASDMMSPLVTLVTLMTVMMMLSGVMKGVDE